MAENGDQEQEFSFTGAETEEYEAEGPNEDSIEASADGEGDEAVDDTVRNLLLVYYGSEWSGNVPPTLSLSVPAAHRSGSGSGPGSSFAVSAVGSCQTLCILSMIIRISMIYVIIQGWMMDPL